MADLATYLYDAVAAICPINGVSIGDSGDRATWHIDYAAVASAGQRKAAAGILAALDPAKLPMSRLISKTGLLDRIGPAAIDAVLAADNATVKRWLEYFRAAKDPLDVSLPRMQAGFAALVAAGLLTAEQRDALLL